MPIITFDEFVLARTTMMHRLAHERALRLGRPIFGADIDDDDMQDEIRGHDTPPICFHVIYRDHASRLSGRNLTVRRIQAELHEIRVSAFCHLRHALRCFLASRMVEVIDLSTGEVFDEGLDYFRHHPLFHPLDGEHLARLSPTTLAIQECRDEIIVLSFLAASDGNFTDTEEDYIVAHVLDRVCDPDVTEAAVRARIRQFIPDEGAFDRALARLCAGEGDARLLMHTMRRIIDSDGRIDPAEFAFAEEIESRLQSAGR